MAAVEGNDVITPDDHLTDVMSEIAAALGWCVGVLDGLGKPGDVPVWVRNALHKATRPLSTADVARRVERRRLGSGFLPSDAACGSCGGPIEDDGVTRRCVPCGRSISRTVG